MPTPANLAALAVTKSLGRCRSEPGLAVADRLMAGSDAANEEHLGQVTQAQLLAQPPTDHEGDNLKGTLGSVLSPVLVELLAAGGAPETGGNLGSCA
jgi:hypothetical protein